MDGEVRRLCRALLGHALRSPSEGDLLLTSLQLPDKMAGWSDKMREKVVRKLTLMTFDLLLLRKWAWFGSWRSHTPLSPLCWCRGYCYECHSSGREREGNRLKSTLATFSECRLFEEREAILKFLCLLSVPHTPPVETNSSFDSGVFCHDLSTSSLFQQLPDSAHLDSVHHAIDHTSLLFSRPPGSGFRGFISSHLQDVDKMPSASSLFDGLTHSTTASLNTSLSFPLLPSHPHLITLHRPRPNYKPVSVLPSPQHTAHSLTETERDDVSHRTWEGWLHYQPFLTEAGEEALKHAHFLSSTHLPSSPTEPMKLHPLINSQAPPTVERGGVSHAFESVISRLEQYLQTATDKHHNLPAMARHVGEHELEPLQSLLTSVQNTAMTGLEAIDALYRQCSRVQGTARYPLLLSLLYLSITPHTHFLRQWLFHGWLDEGEEFGIHSNHAALQCRDHHYWSDGYTASEPCALTFLSRHGQSVMECGKALNLLRLIDPQHPLCGQEVKPPPVSMATSLEQLEELTRQCQIYFDGVCERVEEEKSRRQQQAQKEAREAMEAVLEARRRVREALLAERELEREMEEQRARERHQWLLELQTGAKEARMLRVEQEREERERDKEMVAVLVGRDQALSTQEKKIADQLRAELVAHYDALNEEAELRRKRAEWREARWQLSERRGQWMEEDHWEMREEVTVGDGDNVKPSLPPSSRPSLPPSSRPSLPPSSSTTADTTSTFLPDITTLPDSSPFPCDMSSQTQEDTESQNREEIEKSSGPTIETAVRGNKQGSTRPTRPQMVIRAHAPPSTIQDIIHHGVGMADHTPRDIQTPNPPPDSRHLVSSRGQAPPTTIQHLLYPLRQEEATPPEMSVPKATPTLGEFPSAPPQQYTLSFPQLDDVPSTDILTHVIGPIPVQHGMEPDIMLLPLSFLVGHTLSLPLLTQNHLVNSALLDHFLTSCHMTSHFLSLKQFLLLGDGEFALSLATQLFHKLRIGGVAEMMSPTFLNPLLQSALDSSLHGNSPNAELLTFAVSGSPPSHPHAVDALDSLQLQYKVEWPCNVVITENSLKKYNRVFHLLLQLRRTSWALKNVFTQVQQCEGLDKHQKRQLQIHRHELQHFVDVMEGYITNQLFYLTWREFQQDLSSKVHTLDDLITAHNDFIDKAIFRCLLSKKAAAVMKIIHTVFSCILRFSTTLTSSLHPSPRHHYHSMCHAHRKFREAAGLLMKVVVKLVERGYQPHLEDLLLRLNFNHFYG